MFPFPSIFCDSEGMKNDADSVFVKENGQREKEIQQCRLTFDPCRPPEHRPLTPQLTSRAGQRGGAVHEFHDRTQARVVAIRPFGTESFKEFHELAQKPFFPSACSLGDHSRSPWRPPRPPMLIPPSFEVWIPGKCLAAAAPSPKSVY